MLKSYQTNTNNSLAFINFRPEWSWNNFLNNIRVDCEVDKNQSVNDALYGWNFHYSKLPPYGRLETLAHIVAGNYQIYITQRILALICQQSGAKWTFCRVDLDMMILYLCSNILP